MEAKIMKAQIPDGVWPTMLTPFTNTNKIDYLALEKLINWYIDHQVNGLFAVCQSSEMFYLTLEERVQVASFVKENVKGRVPVIASGHISESLKAQVKELNEMAQTGINALVLITNRFAGKDESDDLWFENMEKLLKEIPEYIALGLYECPYPYKRVLSPLLLKRCADTGRFYFLKDTSCDIENIKAKIEVTKGSGLKIYNANSATLLESLELGVSGYSGVMANFHPELYVWMIRNWSAYPEKAKRLSNFLSVSSHIEKQLYPVNAKYSLSLDGILANYLSRSNDYELFSASNRLEIEQLSELTKEYIDKYTL
jgi:4-hydroxy-tetrahydrodipicolinate synthase